MASSFARDLEQGGQPRLLGRGAGAGASADTCGGGAGASAETGGGGTEWRAKARGAMGAKAPEGATETHGSPERGPASMVCIEGGDLLRNKVDLI